MASHLYIEIQFICICFFAILLYRIMRLDDRRTSQIYLRLLLIASMLTFLFDAAQAALLDFDPTNHIELVYLFNVLYYVFLGFMCYYWFLYSEAEQDSVLAASSPMRAKMAIPLMLLVILTATTPWTHLLFYIDDQGEYVRGGLHWVQLVISYIYCFPTAIKAYVLSCKTTDYAAKSHLRTTSYLILPVVFTGIAQAFLPNLPILCAGCCDSVLFGYIALQEENISIDPLTKVNNRRRMLHQCQHL